ncbi:TonB-dependent receptor plug domain-containing protein, partial [candidate division CSSED10-310 bacterium]
MKRCLLIFLITFFATVLVLAQDEIEYDESYYLADNFFVVTAGRHEQRFLEVPATINVINTSDITLSSAVNLADMLREVVGVSIARHPGNFPQFWTVIRGFHSDFVNERTLVMIDGVPIYHPHGGGIDLGWISLSLINKIEVIKGPVSAVYGANAFGGLINIITKSGSQSTSSGFFGAGVKIMENLDNGDTVTAPYYLLNVGGRAGPVNYFLSADGFFNKDGYMESHQSQENIDIFGKIGLHVSERAHITFLALHSQDHMLVGFENAPDPLENELTHVATSVDVQFSDHYSFQVRGYANNFRNYVNYDDELAKYESLAQVTGGEIQNTFTVGRHIIIIGADIHRDEAELTTWEFDWSAGYPPPVKQAGYQEKSTQSIGI